MGRMLIYDKFSQMSVLGRVIIRPSYPVILVDVPDDQCSLYDVRHTGREMRTQENS